MAKTTLSFFLSLGVAAWCAYDLWIAADPGTTGTRILNYFLLGMSLAGVYGAVLLTRRRTP